MDDIIKEFLVESNENLDLLDRNFIALEKSPGDKELLSSIFRVIHTIKGTCGFLGFNKLEKVSHVGENLLSKLRDGQLSLNQDITNALLSMVDAIRKMLVCIEEKENDGEEIYQELISLLSNLSEGKINNKKAEGISTPDNIATKEETADKSKNSLINDSTIRVNVKLLDKLMNLVGELVLSRNQILQFTNKQMDSSMQASSQRLNIITNELQESVMKTRMQPIDNIWSKFPRVIRDLAQSLGKKVEVKMEGKETEIDKSIIESIKDPLTHLVRNAVDHGIELPTIRKENNKNETGLLTLKAYHEGGMVNIEISDDGSGIDFERVKKKALEKGLFTQDQLINMKENELINILIMPGFSTAEKVTNVSGRGVGMDVVKTNIEKIGGVLDIKSLNGIGTSIRIKIPITLAIIPALIVSSENEQYAIPQVSLVELVMLEEEQIKKNIELIDDVAIYRLRGNLLPLLRLNSILGMNPENNQSLLEKPTVIIVILQASNKQFGLVVDSINDTQEIVVKPLSKILKSINVFSGATIMGDGNIALILDAIGIAQTSGLLSTLSYGNEIDKYAQQKIIKENTQSLLIFKSDIKHTMAINLDLVARLEEFNHSQIEYAGNQELVQYRNNIMPLIYLPKLLGLESNINEKNNATLQVVVCHYNHHLIGLVVTEILDIIQESTSLKQKKSRKNLSSSAIIQGKVMEIINVEEIIKLALPDYSILMGDTQ